MNVTVPHRGYVLTSTGRGASRRWTASHEHYGPVVDERGTPIAFRGLLRLKGIIDSTFTPACRRDQ